MAGTRKTARKNGLPVDVPELAGKVKKTATRAAGEAGDVLGEVKDKVAEGVGTVFEAVKERLPGDEEPKRRSRSSAASSSARKKSTTSSSTRSKSASSAKSRASASSTRSGDGTARAAKKS